jgi:hypothetical protein
MGKSRMRGWLEFPDTYWGQDSNLGGGAKIINQTFHSVKNIHITAEQFQYNSVHSRLGKEARYAGLARRCGCSRWGMFPDPEPCHLLPPRIFLQGGKSTPQFFPFSDEPSVITGPFSFLRRDL